MTQSSPETPVVAGGGADNGSNEPKRGKGILLVIIGVLVILLISIGLGVWLYNRSQSSVQAPSTTLPTVSVSVTPNGFTPASVKVKKGQQVTFSNNDSEQHQLTADQTQLTGFDTNQPLTPGDTYTYTFEKAGTYHYYDPNNTKTFTGTVVVE